MVNKKLIENWRTMVKLPISSLLFKTNYEGMGEQDKEEFERDFDEILDLALIGLKYKAQLSQERTEKRTETHACDLISRQAAIDALNTGFWGVEWDKALATAILKDLPPAKPEPSEITDEQAILHLQSTGWMQNHDREMYESGLREQLADDSGGYDSLIPCEDTISRQAAIDALDCINGAEEVLRSLPPAQPERTCVNCSRTVNNGGWYADGGTRCPIEEHYALPKDGYCHLWEKRNVTDDDYPERRTDE